MHISISRSKKNPGGSYSQGLPFSKYYLDFTFITLYFVKYYLDSMLGKLHIVCTLTVNLETSICNLGRILFHNNSQVRCPLFFTELSAFFKKMVQTLIFLRENAGFNIVSQFNINNNTGFPAIIAYLKHPTI